MYKLINLFSSTRGMTLIEVLTSFVILTIIIISLVPIFIQSAKTNEMAEEIFNATYVAQAHMEEIYYLSTKYEKSEGILQLEKMGYTKKPSSTNILLTKEKSNYIVQIEVSSQDKLSNVIVKILTNDKQKTLKAQMETLLIWRVGDA